MLKPADLPTEMPDAKALLQLHVTRESKITRIRAIEKALENMELEDEENDPVIIRGHIRLTRGTRFGCAVMFACFAIMSLRVVIAGHNWAVWLAIVSGIAGMMMFMRGFFYRPDPMMIQAAYKPHHGSLGYRALVAEMDILARALSQGLKAEDEG